METHANEAATQRKRDALRDTPHHVHATTPLQLPPPVHHHPSHSSGIMTHNLMLARPTSTLVAPLPCAVGHKFILDIRRIHVTNVTSPVMSSLMLILEAAVDTRGRRPTIDPFVIGRAVHD
jgi:hypothetical protein